jgi:hypothetical protein
MTHTSGRAPESGQRGVFVARGALAARNGFTAPVKDGAGDESYYGIISDAHAPC